ncbi:hypothetical protein [Amycolatopsis sp. NBC_01286]|uniref:hypothetical protein n=1 Tax=Amycolatopsis sp. NBC_01286 TaxID=2903560 RepID=UPI002E12D0C3|nr:hypothetical protein OG570_40515 [Amycolatopsis sp. NBC_01286]
MRVEVGRWQEHGPVDGVVGQRSGDRERRDVVDELAAAGLDGDAGDEPVRLVTMTHQQRQDPASEPADAGRQAFAGFGEGQAPGRGRGLCAELDRPGKSKSARGAMTVPRRAGRR